MKILNSIFAVLLFSGVALAQAPTKPAAADTKQPVTKTEPTKPVPQLTEEEKTQILFLQRNIARIDVNISNEQKQQTKLQNDLYTLAQTIQKRIGPDFTIDPDALIVVAKPVPTVPVATSAPTAESKK